jgi:hypothetical protein
MTTQEPDTAASLSLDLRSAAGRLALPEDIEATSAPAEVLYNFAAAIDSLRRPVTALIQIADDTATLDARADGELAACEGAPHPPAPDTSRPPWYAPAVPPELLDLPTGAPLGVGEVAFHTTTVALHPGDELVLYTDGLVRHATRPSMNVWTLSSPSSQSSSDPSRRRATCSCMRCASRETTTTWPCSSPERAPVP